LETSTSQKEKKNQARRQGDPRGETSIFQRKTVLGKGDNQRQGTHSSKGKSHQQDNKTVHQSECVVRKRKKGTDGGRKHRAP